MIMKVARTLFLFVFLISAGGATASPYIVVDVQTGRVLAHNDAFDRWYPASLTKMMTAYVAFRALQRGEVTLEMPVTISAAAAKLPPSRSGYKANTTLTLDSALTVMLVKSANDVAMAIGERVSGSAPAFVRRMNMEAERLGMLGSHFANANGLPDSANYSTARDMALLAAQIRREFPQYAHYFGVEAIDFSDGRKVQPNSNNLMGRFKGADGMKTGFICASGFNLAASATRNGRTIIAVVLGADRVDAREALAAQLLTAGFKTSGSPELTLANMRPYGANLMEATNMRPLICSEEAWQVRMQYRDQKGNTIFNSPFIGVLNTNPNVVRVQLLSTPKKPVRGALPTTNAPIPALRPQAAPVSPAFR